MALEQAGRRVTSGRQSPPAQ